MILNDTIAAIATPRGSGGIAIIRLSGENAETIAAEMVHPYGGKKVSELESHKLTLSRVCPKGREDLNILKQSGHGFYDRSAFSVFYAGKLPHRSQMYL